MRKALFGLIAICLGIVVPLLLAEIALRLLPVSTGLRTQPVDATHPVAHFEPDFDFVYSAGWTMRRANRGHVNNVGFVNDQDYVIDDPRPLLAVVGDSYIQAMMVPFADTLEARLAKSAGDKGRVYSFAQSGAPLSQYLIWAQYAARTFKAAGIVVTVVGNDFDESLLKYKQLPSQTYFAEDADGHLHLKLVDYRPSWLRRVASHSALIRYLTLNVNLMAAVVSATGGAAPPNNFPQTDPAKLSPELIADSNRAADAFLTQLPEMTGLPPDRILLAVDAVRDNIYAGDGSEHDAYFTTMRTKLLADGKARGFETIDLDPVFTADWKDHHQHFEFPDDGHWNGYGHGVVAAAIARSHLYATLFGAVRP